jgi:ribose transport system substrate-binding protein
MPARRKTLFLAAIVLLLTLALIPLSIWNRAPDLSEGGEKPRIALVLGMRHGDYWKTVYMGAESAARESGANLSFLAPDDEEDVKGQVDAVNQALADGADALVLASIDDVVMVETVERAARQVPVIAIDSHVKSSKVKSYIGTDNYAAGLKAAEEMLLLLEGKPARIGIIGFVQGTQKAVRREQGFLDEISKHPEIEVVDKVYSFSNQQLAVQYTKDMLLKHGKLDGLVALNSIASLGAADALEKLGLHWDVKLVAFDSTVQELELLQKGVIQATVVQNPFAMGYLGVQHALGALSGRKLPETVDTGSKVIRLDNMFSAENQKLLFPLLR